MGRYLLYILCKLIIFLCRNLKKDAPVTVNVTVGHKVKCTIVYLDQNGNPMLIPPTPNAPPIWSQSDDTILTLMAAPDGSYANAVAVKAGPDTVTVNLMVGETGFSAPLQVVVSDAPQTLTSIAIDAEVT